MTSNQGTYAALLDFLDQLKAAGIYHEVSDHTGRAIMVHLVIPGERWEVEFHEDGDVGVEVFRTIGLEMGRRRIDELIANYKSGPAVKDDDASATGS